MLRPLARENSVFVAAILTIGTLAVFYLLQNYGPESAVRRFHSAVQTRDLKQLAEVSLQDVRSRSVQQLAARLHDVIAAAQPIRLYSVDRKPGQVVVFAEYQLRDSRFGLKLPWLVRKVRSRGWSVDAAGTWVMMTRSGL